MIKVHQHALINQMLSQKKKKNCDLVVTLRKKKRI